MKVLELFAVTASPALQMPVARASVYTENDGIYLANLEVGEKFRMKGTGNMMVRLCIDVFGADTLVVEDTNTDAIRLYKRCGFEVVKSYYAADLGSGVYLMKLITQREVNKR